MRIRDHPATAAAAILLAGLAALPGLLGGRGWPRPASVIAPARPHLPAPGTRARERLEWCRENVAMIHDVYWAAACAAAASPANPDDSPECTLPNERARPLNAARAKAEQKCLDDALAGVGGAPVR